MKNNSWILDKLIFFFIALALFAVPAFFSTTIANAFTIEKHTIFRICVFMCLALTAVKMVYFPIKIDWPKVFWLIPLFWLVALFSTLFSPSPTVSLWGIHLRLDGLVTLSFFVTFYFLIFINIRGQKNIRDLTWVIALTSLIPVIYALVQKTGNDPIDWKGVVSAERVFGTTGNPAYLAAYLMFVIPVTFYLFGTVKNILIKYFLLALFVAQILTVIFTMTRASYLGLFLEIFLLLAGYFYLTNQKKYSLYLLIGFVAAGLFLTYINLVPSANKYFSGNKYLQRVTEIAQFDSGTGRDRLEMWKIALKALRANPLLGTGLTSYATAFNQYYPNYMDGRPEKDRYSNYPHNLILDYNVSFGMLGVGVLLATIFLVLYLVVKKILVTKNFYHQMLLLGVGVAVAGYFVQALFNIETIITWTYFYTFLALILVAIYFCEPAEQKTLPTSISAVKQIGLTVMIIACLTGTKILAIDPARADLIYFDLSSNPKLTADQKLEMVKAADSLIPYYEYSKMKISDWYLASIDNSNPNSANLSYRQATEQIQKAIEINPSNFKNFYSLGLVYGNWSKIDSQKLALAEENLLKAQELSPNRLGIHFGWGDMYLELGLIEKAYGQYEQARKLNPEIGETYYNLAKVAVLQNNGDLVRKNLNLAIEKGFVFDEAEFWQKMSLLALQIGKPKIAGLAANTANQFEPTEKQVLIEIQAQLDLSNTTQARELAEKYVKTFPAIKSKVESLLK
ncbi:MAG: O-antigen ligase family protein [Patescibacteria group bacterium]